MMNSQWANLGSVWLVITPDNMLFEVHDDLQLARRKAKAINGYMVELDIFEDYRRLTPERELTPTKAPPYPGSLNRIGSVASE
jgi:hypothetical protein